MKQLSIGLLLLLALPHPATAKDDGAPAPQQRAFQLGFALQAPAAQTEEFLQAVKGLKTITDDVQGTSEVGKLARQAAALRETEARAYEQASQIMHTMGAPSALQTWATGTVETLRAPLVLSKEAKGFLVSDPNTAAVMGTIDEAQAVKIMADKRRTSLVTWVKLSQGSRAIWATTLGGLAAGMDAALMTDRGLFLSRTDVQNLHNTAPVGTPSAVLDALDRLSPTRGNLAGLIRLPAAQISPKELTEPHKTLLSAYAARPLADTIDKG